MSRIFVMGDVHGALRALLQCLERSAFNYRTDHLICLGDVCDGWPDTKSCVGELLKINNLTYILGNHDLWTLQWMQTGYSDPLWLKHGGKATIQSYADGVPDKHRLFLEEAKPYVIRGNTLFVHAGIDPLRPITKQTTETFLWDRTLALKAIGLHPDRTDEKLTLYDETYIGHTPVPFAHPVLAGGVWLMDTGAGWSGVLSMMDINTKEVFSSDVVPSLYPGVQGRTKAPVSEDELS